MQFPSGRALFAFILRFAALYTGILLLTWSLDLSVHGQRFMVSGAERMLSQIEDPEFQRELMLEDLNELVRRDVYDDYPPVTSYRLNRRARSVHDALVPLAHAI